MSARVFLALLLIGAAGGGLLAQSLADVAKKEEERRKTVKAPAKVYTNKDLSGAPPPPPVSSSTPAKAAPPAAGEGKDEKDAKEAKDKEPAKDQAYWAGRLKALQQQLDRDQTFADALQSQINAQNTDFVNRDDPAQRAVIERNRQKSIAQQNQLKKAIEDDKKAIADLMEEARRAGVPPGWLR